MILHTARHGPGDPGDDVLLTSVEAYTKFGQFVSAAVMAETVSKCVTVVKILTLVSSFFPVVADTYVFFIACGGKNSI